ncbi:MAG: hypothetical protein MK097_21310, partial [Dechloromonas sp.]|nr:hypothetical protein [Dechloromonas sp.]
RPLHGAWVIGLGTGGLCPFQPPVPGARRRRGAPLPIDGGRGTTWIGAQLGVTKQAVDGFVKYKQRNAHADK